MRLEWIQFNDSLPKSLCKVLGQDFVDYTKIYVDREEEDFLRIEIPRKHITTNRTKADELRVLLLNETMGINYIHAPYMKAFVQESNVGHVIDKLRCIPSPPVS
ncbi:MAG: hypothetical protein HRT44_04715 [Bdellovibrionales bacterium]|nr:hypothetical protein [Bdellovibrionales bacterium]NQZ18545.1 hypothetical protein [Bdellovibrionales bacterium]